MTQILNKKMHKDLVEQDTIRTRWEVTFSFVTKNQKQKHANDKISIMKRL